MSSPAPIRFDALVRSERYFTATLLPALLIHNGFCGLDRILALVDTKTRRQGNQPTDRLLQLTQANVSKIRQDRATFEQHGMSITELDG